MWKSVMVAVMGLATVGCASASSHATAPSRLGAASSSSALESAITRPGPIVVTAVESATWQVDRTGLINLGHERARRDGIEAGLEPISIFFWVVEHPTRGTFVVDSGVARMFREPDTVPANPLLASQMHFELMDVRVAMGEWLERNGPIDGVFLTHIHLDHVSGMPDVPDEVPVYAGPGETEPVSFENLFVAGTIDALLDGKGPLREWPYAPDPEGVLDGVVDVFGDGSLFAIHVPGHTPGSTAYLARTPEGPVLMVGDASHTEWGWLHCVEPGSFNEDPAASASSLAKLRALVARTPGIRVMLGHQHLDEHAEAEACAE